MIFGVVWVEDHANNVVALEVARIASRIVSKRRSDVRFGCGRMNSLGWGCPTNNGSGMFSGLSPCAALR